MAHAKKLDADTGLSPPSIMEHYAELRKLLLHRRNQLLSAADAERAEVNQQVLGSPGDIGDASVVDASADYFLALADNDRHELLDIRDAFERMQRGTYGLCETCENDIPIERLRKIPYARRCVDCQSTLEMKFRTSRPTSTPKL